MPSGDAPVPDEAHTGREKRRVFFALWPDETVARQLHAIARRHAAPDARIMRRETLHLTLAFIGDIDAARLPAIEAVGDAVLWPRFDMTLSDFGLWRHNHILWAAPGQPPDALAAVADDLAKGLHEIGIALEKRAFHPHLTLARRCAQLRPHDASASIQWRVREGVLVESQRDAQGARYAVRRRWPAREEG